MFIHRATSLHFQHSGQGQHIFFSPPVYFFSLDCPISASVAFPLHPGHRNETAHMRLCHLSFVDNLFERLKDRGGEHQNRSGRLKFRWLCACLPRNSSGPRVPVEGLDQGRVDRQLEAGLGRASRCRQWRAWTDGDERNPCKTTECVGQSGTSKYPVKGLPSVRNIC
jgi:hypothetical protein